MSKQEKESISGHEKVANWIYNPVVPEEEAIFGEIEKALGFKLLAWQKTYILQGHFRKFGATTAQCLKKLIFDGPDPLDLTGPQNRRSQIECEMLWNIKKRLEEAGIKTRTVYFTKEDKMRADIN